MLSPFYHSQDSDVLKYAGLVFFASISFYSFHRLYSLWRLLPNLPTERWKAVYKLQRWLFALVPLGFLCALILFFTLPWTWQWRIAFPAIVSALYAIPLIKWKRLRDFGSAKVVWLSVGWVWLCTVVPLSAIGSLDWWIVIERLLFLIGLTLAFDWRDTKQDQMERVITWPLRLGRRKTMWLSIGLLSLSICCITQFKGLDLQHWIVAMALGLTTVMTMFFILFAYAKTRPHHLYYGFYMDGFLILPILFILVLENTLWLSLGN